MIFSLSVQPILLIGGKMEEKKVVSTGGAGVGVPQKVSHLRPLSTFIHPPCASFSPCPISPPDRGLAGVPHQRRRTETQCVAPLETINFDCHSIRSERSAIDFWVAISEKIGEKIPIHSLRGLHCSTIMQIIFSNFSDFFWNYFDIFRGKIRLKNSEKC